MLSNAGRSRRTACESCAKSKIKCDLEQPCSKCVNRGRECVYLNDPNASKEKSKQSPTRAPSLPKDILSDSLESPDNRTPPTELQLPEDPLTLPSLVDDTGSVSPPSFQASLSPQSQPSIEYPPIDNFEIVDPNAAPLGFGYDMSYVEVPSEPTTCPHAEDFGYLPRNMESHGEIELSMAQFSAMISSASSPLTNFSTPRMPSNLPAFFQHQQQELDLFTSLASSSPFIAPSTYSSPSSSFSPQPQLQGANTFGSIWTPVETKVHPADASLSLCQEKNRYCGFFLHLHWCRF
jgi:hypothetical protein